MVIGCSALAILDLLDQRRLVGKRSYRSSRKLRRRTRVRRGRRTAATRAPGSQPSFAMQPSYPPGGEDVEKMPGGLIDRWRASRPWWGRRARGGHAGPDRRHASAGSMGADCGPSAVADAADGAEHGERGPAMMMLRMAKIGAGPGREPRSVRRRRADADERPVGVEVAAGVEVARRSVEPGCIPDRLVPYSSAQSSRRLPTWRPGRRRNDDLVDHERAADPRAAPCSRPDDLDSATKTTSRRGAGGTSSSSVDASPARRWRAGDRTAETAHGDLRHQPVASARTFFFSGESSTSLSPFRTSLM